MYAGRTVLPRPPMSGVIGFLCVHVGLRPFNKRKRSPSSCSFAVGAPVTPTPIESNLLRSPAHAPHIRGLKGPRTRRAGDAHADRVEIAALPRARPARPWPERATDAACRWRPPRSSRTSRNRVVDGGPRLSESASIESIVRRSVVPRHGLLWTRLRARSTRSNMSFDYSWRRRT